MTAVTAKTNHYDELLGALGGITTRGGGPQHAGRCPAHEDRNPSLSWTLGEDGRILVNCHAGCTAEAIVAALGFEMADLFPPTITSIVSGSGHMLRMEPPLLTRRPAARGDHGYTARFVGGVIAGRHRRKDDGRGGKRVWWEPAGIEPKNLALYGTDKLTGDETTLVIVEGERATLALNGPAPHDLTPAVGTYGTDVMPSDEALEICRGKGTIYLWPDNDKDGWKHMSAIGVRIIELGIATTLKWVRPPAPAEPKWDAADADVEQIYAAIQEALPVPATDDVPFVATPDVLSGSRLVENLADYLAAAETPIDWAVEGAAAQGSLTEFLGQPRSFKTFAALQLGLAALLGKSWLGLEVSADAVLYVSNEKTKATIAHRLRTMLAGEAIDPDRFQLIHRKGVVLGGRHWDTVLAAVDELRARFGSVIVILDTLNSLSKPGFDENKGADMNGALDATRQLTNEREATVFLLHHPPRDEASQGRGRGHSSLDGEVEGTFSFERFFRTDPPRGQATLSPKDGEERTIPIAFNPDTFELSQAALVPPGPGRDSAIERDAKDEALLRSILAGTTLLADLIAVGSHGKKTAISDRAARLRTEGLLDGTGKTTPYGVTNDGQEWLRTRSDPASSREKPG